MADPVSSHLSSDFYNRLVREGVERYKHTIRLIFRNWMQTGHLPGVEPKEPEEELADLQAQALQLLETAQAGNEFEKIDAGRKLLRLEELEAKLGSRKETQAQATEEGADARRDDPRRTRAARRRQRHPPANRSRQHLRRDGWAEQSAGYASPAAVG